MSVLIGVARVAGDGERRPWRSHLGNRGRDAVVLSRVTKAHRTSSRRELLGMGAALGAGALAAVGLLGCAAKRPAVMSAAAAAPAAQLFRGVPIPLVRVGFVGVGLQGSGHVANLLKISGCEVRALCDIVPSKVEKWTAQIVDAGFKAPTGYTRGPRDFERMCGQEDLDLVYTATPWEWHAPVCLAALRAGKHAATEVPMAPTLDELWAMVEASEKTRRHCVMMENCCYDRTALLVLHMVRRGVLGELLHGEGGYLHDLRAIKFAEQDEGLWRRAHARRRNGNLYPTHGLGPIAQCMNVNRGDRFASIVSFSSKTRGLARYAEEHFSDDDPRRQERFALGDVNVSLIKTELGCTIYLAHNCDSPRPYSRVGLVQGTKGIVSGYPPRVHIEGMSPPDRWEPLDGYYDAWDHPIWKREAMRATGAGHGGMDFIEDGRLVECLRAGEPLDMDAYDGAAWSAMSELSERSVAANGAPQEVPDFTRGAWRSRPPLGIVGGGRPS